MKQIIVVLLMMNLNLCGMKRFPYPLPENLGAGLTEQQSSIERVNFITSFMIKMNNEGRKKTDGMSIFIHNYLNTGFIPKNQLGKEFKSYIEENSNK